MLGAQEEQRVQPAAGDNRGVECPVALIPPKTVERNDKRQGHPLRHSHSFSIGSTQLPYSSAITGMVCSTCPGKGLAKKRAD